MGVDEARDAAQRIIEDPNLSFHQRRHYLASVAENLMPYPDLSAACAEALDKRIICDMFEGSAPYRPRYVLPDYRKALEQGSEYLELEPPADLDDALMFLLIFYTQVPSITGYPVFLGDLDALLEPFAEGHSDAELRAKLRRFWISLDRILPDGFVHANIGPQDGRVVRAILEVDRTNPQTVPNLTLKVGPDTPDSLIEEAVRTVFETGKPHFVNDPMMVAGLGDSYGVVSCYNSLKKGGGSHTLVRLNLKEVALQHQGTVEEFIATTLPRFAELNAELMEARIRYLVEEAGFFNHDFLAREGVIALDRFSAMYGVYGTAEAVNHLMDINGKPGRYGHDQAANDAALAITEALREFVDNRPMPYCTATGGHALLHSQSGIDSDLGVSAGVRVPIGDEPGLFEHIATVAPLHQFFDAGVSDIFHIDDTVRSNPGAMVDVIRGAFSQGMRDFTFNIDSNDFVRITGYMVRKSELAKYAESGERHSSTVFAAGSMENSQIPNRNMKRVLVHERNPGIPE
jgi:YjjI family glycine radical enzyme